MHVTAAIEVSALLNMRVQEEVVTRAYRLSSRGVVLLMLNGVDRAVVDRCLDRVVEEQGTDVAGVRYLDAQRTDTLAGMIDRGSSVIASTEPLWKRLREAGITAQLKSDPDELQAAIALLPH